MYSLDLRLATIFIVKRRFLTGKGTHNFIDSDRFFSFAFLFKQYVYDKFTREVKVYGFKSRTDVITNVIPGNKSVIVFSEKEDGGYCACKIKY